MPERKFDPGTFFEMLIRGWEASPLLHNPFNPTEPFRMDALPVRDQQGITGAWFDGVAKALYSWLALSDPFKLICGNTLIGDVSVEGGLAVESDLEVSGSFALEGELEAGPLMVDPSYSAVTISGTLTVFGALEVGPMRVDPTHNEVMVLGTLKIDPAYGTLEVQSLDLPGWLRVGGDLTVQGSTTLAGLTAGATSLAGLTVSGDVQVRGETTLAGLTVSGDLEVQGSTTLSGLTAGASSLASLVVSGATQLEGSLTFGTAGSLILPSAQPSQAGGLFWDGTDLKVYDGTQARLPHACYA